MTLHTGCVGEVVLLGHPLEMLLTRPLLPSVHLLMLARADKRWAALTNALSGLFCASLNFIDSTRTIRPVLSFQPSGHHSPAALERLHLLHGSLPREPVCTENLTPFLKLLPCKGKAGISSLLDGHKLFDAQWQSMSIDIAPVCTAPGQCHLQLVQTVDMVLDVDRSLALRDSPVPRPKSVDQLSCDPTKPYAQTTDGCFPQDDVSDLAWSLQELFGRPIRGHCPLAVSSSGAEQHEPVCADVPLERAIFITPGAKENKYVSGQRCFVLEQDTDFDIMVPEQTPPVARPFPEPPLYAERSFTGQGQERGGMQTVLRNPNPTDGVDFIYLESLPWSMKPYLHTLAVTLVSPSSASPPEKLIREVYYRPALDRHRGTQLEVALHVPANSTAVLTYDFEKAILRYTEYPPDANRGFDIAPAVITVLPPPGSGKRPFAIRTTSLLLYLPTPDFSMPYNVIILTSTVMALAFGNIFNILSRRFVAADEVPRRRAVENLRAKVLAVVAGVRRVLERRANRGAKAAKSE